MTDEQRHEAHKKVMAAGFWSIGDGRYIESEAESHVLGRRRREYSLEDAMALVLVAEAKPTPRPTCGTCPMWERVGDKSIGECRGACPPGFREDTDAAWAIGDWPVTDDDEWCGQHPDMAAWIETEWPKVKP